MQIAQMSINGASQASVIEQQQAYIQSLEAQIEALNKKESRGQAEAEEDKPSSRPKR